MDIKEIIQSNKTPAQVIADLKRVSKNLPSWVVLEKEYDPKKHSVMTDPNYITKVKNGKEERVTKITLGLQKLAVKRMTGLMFSIDVVRIYNDHEDEQQKLAAKIMEDIYCKNHINAINKERGRWLFAACEVMTLWYTQEQQTAYAEQNSPYKLRCKNFSPFSNRGKKSENIYALFDDYDDLIALSVEYSREEDGVRTNYFETYTIDTHIRWRNTEGNAVEELRETYDTGKLPGVYIQRAEPVWEDQTPNVEEIEWALSRNGNYIRKNSRPTWVVATDEDIETGQESTNENEGRNVLRYPADAKYGYATWPQAIDSLKFQIEEVKRNFFMTLQLPDMSMDNMKSTPMSGEARKMVFIDGEMKVLDESGIWIEAFEREASVIKSFMKKMYPALAPAIDALVVEHRITPYRIKDEGERFSNLSTAIGGKPFMSQRTAIKEAAYVDDVDAEMTQIATEEARDVTEPTF